MNLTDFGEPLTFLLVPLADQFLLIQVNHLIDASSQKLGWDRDVWSVNILYMHGSQMMNPKDFGDPLTFHIAPL